MQEYLDVGQIVNTHGVRGEVKVIPYTDNIERFDSLKFVYIENNGSLEKLGIESTKYFKNTAIIKFKGVDDLNAAEALKSHFIKVDRANAVKLPEDSFFICDLIGCNVFEDSGNLLGILDDIIKTGSNDVYVVKREGAKDILIPALKSVVTSISVPERKIIVKLPEGLMEYEI